MGTRFKRPVRKPVVTIQKKPVLRSGFTPKAKVVERPKPKKLLPPVDPPKPGPDGSLELDAVSSRMLEDELQKIMIKVWQALPDDAPTDEDRRVVEKFRNEASDDLRNALGMSVTQRLLNTFNPLNVKVHFSTKPERKFLRHFLKRYNFVAFKRIVRVSNTFAAQVKTIADYDDLCSNKKIFCGAAKLTISPCYRFMQCPKILKTKYGIPDEDNPIENKSSSNQGTEMDVYDTAPKETKTEKEEPHKKPATATTIEQIKKPEVKKVEEIKPTDKESNIKLETKSNKPAEIAKTTPKPVAANPNLQKTVVTAASTMTSAKPVGNKPQASPVTKTASNNQTQNAAATKKVETAKDNATDESKPTTSNKNSATKIQTTATKKEEVTKDKVSADKKTTTLNTNTKTNIQITATKKVEIVKEKVTDANKAATPNTNIKSNVQTPVTKKVEITKDKVTDNIKTTTSNINTKTNIQTASKPDVEDEKTKTPANPVAASAKTVIQKPTETKNTTKAINVKTTAAVKTTKSNVVPTKANLQTKETVDHTKAVKTPDANTKKVTPVKANTVTPSKTPQTKLVPNRTSAKDTPKNVATKQVVKKPDTKKPSKGDDFEELDDKELYQYLMSAGIVLDECSGSDDE